MTIDHSRLMAIREIVLYPRPEIARFTYNPGKNYRGQRVRQTKLYVFLQNLSHAKNYPPPTPNSMLANHLNILLKFKCGKQH
jgi:hypothetical protein